MSSNKMCPLEQIYGIVYNVYAAVISYVFPWTNRLRHGTREYTVSKVDEKYLHIYTPKIAKEKLLLCFIHGGGWASGGIGPQTATSFGYDFIGKAMATRGITTALIGYPLVRIPPRIQATVYLMLVLISLFLAAVLGQILFSFRVWLAIAVPCYIVSAALLRQRLFSICDFGSTHTVDFKAQYSVIKQQVSRLHALYPGHAVTLVGHSAGGHTVALLALDKECCHIFQHVVCLSGVYDIEGLRKASKFGNRLVLQHVFGSQNADSFSPIKCITSARAYCPKLFVCSAYGDALFLYRQAEQFHRALYGVYGDKAIRVKKLGIGHGIGMVVSDATWDIIEQIIDNKTPK